MSLDKRPYIGTWTLNNQQLVQHTPDALVYINGDLSVPGCQKCSGKIDIQKFLTEVSVDAGTEPGSHSATFSLSIPLHHTDSFARDAKFIIRPGLEVHIYMRGFFPVKGLYSTLAEKKALTPPGASAELPSKAELDSGSLAAPSVTVPPEVSRAFQRLRLNAEQQANAELIYQRFTEAGFTPAYACGAIVQSYGESRLKNIVQSGGKGPGLGLFQLDPTGLGKATPKFENGKKAGRAETSTTYNALDPEKNIAREIVVINDSGTARKMARKPKGTIEQSFQQFYGSPQGKGFRDVTNPPPGYTLQSWQMSWDAGMARKTKVGKAVFGSVWDDPEFNTRATEFVKKQEQAALAQRVPDPVTPGLAEPLSPEVLQGEYGSSLLDEMGLAGLGIENTLAYPYYHVFHGVVTQVSHSYSGGVSTVSVNCSSMLHFWQYHNMSTNASVFGARPTNSKNKMSLVGNNFTGMHPYAIMYALHYDMAGAAGGIGWALANKDNQEAVSEGGESLFSLNIQYWEKRFKRGTKLRMHGATGALFSTMAAAWLSRKSSAVLTKALRDRYNTSRPFAQTNIGSQMVALGLYGGPNVRAAIDATRFAAKSKPTTSAEFEINVLEMQAFVSNIGDWGQVNLFESTYESKLDIANKVCEVTGFEFYQDVDGDFVFKPPMWNLDTSSSRVYRIEDIDIINISFAEAEPQVTYMTVKGSAFKGLLGTGTENEWGVRGQYLDYRLIAQFGWRPGSYETAYFNDPKSMFFAAVNRMDVMNIAVNTASVTIPVRPEIRPGYPVYIPYLDCFYYCNSFAHSHSVGGQCTTALQLVGKRAKFFAPGYSKASSKDGIDAIDLGNTRLPERPLQVLGPEGKPRLSGFPNVVMALDPTAINPLFFVVGTDIENLADARVIKYMLQVGVTLGVLTPEPPPEGTGKQFYTITRTVPATSVEDEPTKVQVRFFFDESDLNPNQDVVDGVINIAAGAARYMTQASKSEKQDIQTQEAFRVKQQEINSNNAQVAAILRDPDFYAGGKQAEALAATKAKLEAAIDKLLREQEILEQQAKEAKNEREKALRDPVKNAGIALLLEVKDQVGAAYRSSADFQGNSDLSSSINLLDMLSDKKATFSNGQQPGQYRYYSASHPDVAQQGPRNARYDGATKRVIDGDPLTLAGDGRDAPVVDMYVKKPVAPFPGAVTPEAELQPGRPVAGIRVLTSNPKKPSEVYATSEITELMFTVQDVTTLRNVGTSFAMSKATGMGKAAAGKVRSHFTSEATGYIGFKDASIQTAFQKQWDTMCTKVQGGINAMAAAAAKATPPVTLKGLSVPAFPAAVQVWSAKVPTTVRISSTYKYVGSSGTTSLGPRGDKATEAEVFTQAGNALGAIFTAKSDALVNQAVKQVAGKGKDKATIRESLAKAWAEGFTVGAAVKTTTIGHGVAAQQSNQTTYSPVFPVSDEKGYHVVGSYRYGRGVDIDPEGVFDQLHKQDIFRLLDKNLVDQILRFFVQRERIAVPATKTVTLKNGKKKVVPIASKDVTDADRANYLNEEALRQLRAANLTDKQILDFSAAINKGSGKPSQLEFSLANLFADTKIDGVQKIPLVNAAYSLADLTVQQAGHVCDCKAAEAQVQLAAFGQEQFVEVSQAGPPTEEGIGPGTGNAATRWVSSQMAHASTQWGQQQQALRGQVLDRGGSTAIPQILDTLGLDSDKVVRPSPYDQALAASARAQGAFEQALSQVSLLQDNVSTSRKEDR